MSGGKDTTSLSLGRETFFAMGAKFGLAAAGFLGIIIFARVLGVDGVGKYYFLLAMAKLAVQVPGGVSTAIKKRVSEVDADPSEYLGIGLLTVVVFTVVMAAFVVVGYPLIRDRVGPFAFAIGAVGIVASLSLFSLTNRLYAGIGHPGASFWTDTIRSVLTLGLQVGFLLVGMRVLGLMYGLVLATLLTSVGVILAANVRPRLPTRETARSVYEFARWSVPNSLTANLYMRLDVIILGFFVGKAAVAYYEPALRLTVPASFIAISISDSLTVKASGLNSIDESVASDLKNALSYTCLFSIPILFGAVAIPESLMVVVFGEEFREGWIALVGLAVFQLFNTFRLPFDNVVDGMNRPDIRFRVSLFTLAVNVPLAVVLGLAYGLPGVVLATILAEVARTVTYVFVAHRLFDEVMLPRTILEQFVAGVVMFGVVLWLSGIVAITGPLTLAAVVGAGGTTYFAVLLVLSSHFRLTIRSVMADLGVDSVP